MAGSRVVGGAYREAIAAAERALALAAELGLPEPARALGMRGAARAYLGERQGLEDMRRALALALEQGQGRAAAVLHNNLALASWQYEGPQAALDACREGIDFCERRGIAEFALGIAAMSTTFLAESGRAEQALAEAGPLAERLEAAGDVSSIEPRSVQLRLLAERGAHEQAPAADELLATARESGRATDATRWRSRPPRGCCSPRGIDSRRTRCWSSSRRFRRSAPTPTTPPPCPRSCAPRSPSRSRSSPSRLVDGVEPRTPLAEHALHAARAQLAEAAGDTPRPQPSTPRRPSAGASSGTSPSAPTPCSARAAAWPRSASPRRRSRCVEARELFASMGYRPALAETDALLERTTAAAS